jgi:predicted Zn-dependent peptidase
VLLFGATLPTAELAQQIDAVTAEDIIALGQQILAPRRAAVSVLGPKSALKAADAFQNALFT